MVTIIVAAHGESAPALLKTASMILGNLDNVYPVTFLPGQGPEDLIEEYTRIVAETGSEETLILVDLFGGSPYNAGARFAAEHENIDVVAGVNVRCSSKLSAALVAKMQPSRAWLPKPIRRV